MTNQFIVEKNDTLVRDFKNKSDALKFAEEESGRDMKYEYIVYDNSTGIKHFLASYKQGHLGLSG